MPDTTPGPASDDAASLTALLGEFGGLWQISTTSHGYTAQRRPPPAPPLVLTAKTVRALRQLLQHGYDAGKLAAIMADFGGQWEVERLDPVPHGSQSAATTATHASSPRATSTVSAAASATPRNDRQRPPHRHVKNAPAGQAPACGAARRSARQAGSHQPRM